MTAFFRLKVARSTLIKSLVSAVLALIIVAALLAQISLRDLANMLLNLNYGWILLGATFYLVTNLGRAARLRVLLPAQHPRMSRLLPVVILQSMLNNVLPARTGELSLVYLLKKYQAVSLERGSVALVVARMVDFLAVAVIFVVAALASLGSLPRQVTGVIWAALAAMALAAGLLVSLAWAGRQSVGLLRRALARAGLDAYRPVVGGLAKLRQVIDAFEAVHSLPRYGVVFGWSVCIWLTTFAWFYAFMRGMAIQTGPLDTVVGATFAVLSKAVPFISVGGLGAHEAGWTVGFILVGFDKTTAIASGFAVNILTLLVSVVFGAVSWGALRLAGQITPAAAMEPPEPVVRQ